MLFYFHVILLKIFPINPFSDQYSQFISPENIGQKWVIFLESHKITIKPLSAKPTK